MKDVYTIGVYGATENTFFEALTKADISDFCDIRARRGMRGSTYAFVNKTRLIERLDAMGIRYHHFRELAPTKEIREAQKHADAIAGKKKRDRTRLGTTFEQRFEEEILIDFHPEAFAKNFPPDARVCLFCVEAEPEACHRSLVAKRLSKDLNLKIVHLSPA